jgi:hypothetical protein
MSEVCCHPQPSGHLPGPGTLNPLTHLLTLSATGLGAFVIVRCAMRPLRRVTSTADEVAAPSLYRDNYAVTLWVPLRAPPAAGLGHAGLTRLGSTALSETPNMLGLVSNSSRNG